MKFKQILFIAAILMFCYFAVSGAIQEIFYSTGVNSGTFWGVMLSGLALFILQYGGDLDR